MLKKFLTSDSFRCYAESLKTANMAFTPRQSVFFMPMARTRAENNQYQPKHLLAAFSESAPLSYLTAKILKKANIMTNTIKKTTETTIQSLYRYYCEMRDTWYKGNYNIKQENIYGAVFYALDDAIMKLPAQNEADRQIKYKHIKNMLTMDGTQDVSGVDKYVLETINSLAAE